LVIGLEVANADLLYPYQEIWSDGAAPHIDVEEADPRSKAYARAIARTPDLVQSDVRFVTYQPGATPPREGSTCAFDGGRLTLLHWGQVDEYDGTALGVAVWVL
jgi:hypothetical protein